MVDDIRTQVIGKIDTRFKTILTTGGYKTNLGSNINWWKDLENNPFQASELPAANLKDSSCDPSPHAMGVDIHDMNIECNVYASTIAATRQVIADIEKVIKTDLKWTALALDTVLLADEIDVTQLENKFFGAIVPFKVSYLTKMGDPYTQP